MGWPGQATFSQFALENLSFRKSHFTFSMVMLDFSTLEREQLRALSLENQLFYSTVTLDFTPLTQKEKNNP